MIKAVGYIRVSSEKQVEHGMSLEAQQAKLTAYAQLYDIELVAVEVDAGISAESLNRPGLQQALHALTRGKAEALLIVKLDRLTGSVKDLGELIDRYFATGKYSLLSVGDQIDTRSAAGRLVLNILASVSQWEREAIGERTAEVMRYKQRQHEYIGGPPPYGWRVTPDGTHLEPHSVEQEIIREALTLKEQGLSLRKIGQALASKGFIPRNGTVWHATSITYLLRAEVA